MIKPKTIDLEDTNCALIGSDIDRKVKEAAAATEDAWKEAGKEFGLQIWRIEKFKVVAWPKEEYGSFYNGDSYIILHTYKEESKKKYNLYFWLGTHTTQDEAGTAAYKTVELDTLLKDEPVQYRVVEGHEPDMFLELFPNGITILEGGVESGFRHVKPEEYKPRLLQVKGKGKNVASKSVECSGKSLTAGDVFILDKGLTIYLWQGLEASAFEKRKAAEVAAQIRESRNGRAKVDVINQGSEPDEFWTLLGGKCDVAPATPDTAQKPPPPVLVRVSDAGGKLEFKKEKDGVELHRSDLDPNDAFVLDVGSMVYLWFGAKCSKQEREKGLECAMQYLGSVGKSGATTMVKVQDGHEPTSFNKYFK